MRDGTTRADVKVREEEKDLGVTFDPSLKFSKHVGVVANKGNRIVGLIRRTFAYMDEDMFRPLYKTLVRPHLDSTLTAYGAHSSTKTSPGWKLVQRRATKMIPSIKDLPYSDRLERLDLHAHISLQTTSGWLVIQLFRSCVDTTWSWQMNLDIDLRGHSMKIQKQHAHLNIRK